VTRLWSKVLRSAETDRPCSHCLLHSIQSANRPGCNRLLSPPSVRAHTTTHSTQVHSRQTALLESCAPHRFWPHKTGAIQTCNACHCWACCWEVAKQKIPCTFLLSASGMSTWWACATTHRPSSHDVVSTGSPITAWRYIYITKKPNSTEFWLTLSEFDWHTKVCFASSHTMSKMLFVIFPFFGLDPLGF
jgi:hypothetical protein